MAQADDSSYRKITTSVYDVSDTLQRTALGENSDTQLDTPWHFYHLQGIASLKGCVTYHNHRVRQFNCPQGMAVSPRLWTDCAEPNFQINMTDTRG